MSYLLDISTAVPNFSATKEELVTFYAKSLEFEGIPNISKKLRLLCEKTKIHNRNSCVPDFNNKTYELYETGNCQQSVEKRMAVFKQKAMPLAIKAIDPLLLKNGIPSQDITHLITVSCTGLFSPGLEFLIAEQYELQHTEKVALNFLGCYAAIKALKHAHYIAQSNPGACILIVCVELCTLHFYPSSSDEDILANLLFADGAAASIVCGNDNKHLKNKVVLNIDAIGSVYIPNTLDLMTWDISSSAFRMYLSKHIVKTIKENIAPVVTDFLKEHIANTTYWAIHPGGIKIVEAVKDSLHLSDSNVEDSIEVLQQYGNMSSPTILFIIEKILNKIKNSKGKKDKQLFACAFGPGLSIEMMQFSSVDNSINPVKSSVKYAIEH
jgi:predicted naringenin-chalcone synthase